MNRRQRTLAYATLLALAVACGPIGPFSGGRLAGEERSWPSSWQVAAELEQIQLETRPDAPHSVNVWVVVVEASPFVATSLLMGADEPGEREWVRNVAANPLVRVRVGGFLYRARLETVTEEALRGRLVEAFRSKYPQLKVDRTSRALFYRIAPREG